MDGGSKDFISVISRNSQREGKPDKIGFPFYFSLKFGYPENLPYICTHKLGRFHLAVRIPASHAGYTGSSPVGATI